VLLKIWGIATIPLLLVFDLLIAATRVSLSNTRRVKLEPTRRSKKVIALLESPRLGAALRLSQTMMRFGIAILSFLLLQIWTPVLWQQLLGLFLLTLFMLFIEFSVEANVLEHAEDWATRLAAFGHTLIFLFRPLVALPMLLLSPRRVSRETLDEMTEDELKIWVESEDSGDLEQEEKRMIYEIFQFNKTMAREIMVPRIDMVALDLQTASLTDAVQSFLDYGYSRLPVYDGKIDNIRGLLYAKDLLPTLKAEDKEVDLSKLLREPYFIPETKKADDLLTEMQESRFHMAIVVDEYGGVSGVVTLEDIIEEIIGEIQDEYDDLEEDVYEEINENEYVFLGRIDLHDFSDIMGTDLPEADADTLAGFIYEKLGRVPQGGESVRENGLLLTIEQLSGRRIRRVRVRKEPPPPPEYQAGEEDEQ